MTGIELIAAERERQVSVEGWTPEHDDMHTDAEILWAAKDYLVAAIQQRNSTLSYVPEHIAEISSSWPWDGCFWKPSPHQIRNLVKTAALLAAEIDRLQRAAESEDRG